MLLTSLLHAVCDPQISVGEKQERAVHSTYS